MDTLTSNIQTVVNELYQEHGNVTPSMLVETAKAKTNPAHDGFEWDNKKAGDLYRLVQARCWLQKVKIIIEDREEKLIRVSVTSKQEEGIYKPISKIVENKDEYQEAFSDVINRIDRAQQSYDELKVAAKKYKDRCTVDFQRADRGFEEINEALMA